MYVGDWAGWNNVLVSERVDMVCCCSFFCWQRAFVRWFVTHRVFVNLVGDPYPTVKNFPPRHESRKEPESPGMMDISSMALHLPAAQLSSKSSSYWTCVLYEGVKIDSPIEEWAGVRYTRLIGRANVGPSRLEESKFKRRHIIFKGNKDNNKRR